MAKTKLIIVNATLKGRGCPNKEGKEGKYLWNAWTRSRRNADDGKGMFPAQFVNPDNDNCVFAKANYSMRNGTIDRTVKISGECLRHNIFGSTNNAAIKEDINTLIAYTASPEGIIRGYFVPAQSNKTTKRKSPITVTDAELTNGAISQIESHSSSGARTDKSFFAKETLGETKFAFTVHIDLSELGVLSCCETFDRPCVLAEYQHLYEKKLTANGIGFKKVALRKKNDVQPEICYKLDDKSVNYLVNLLLHKITQLHFGNATEYVQFDSMTVFCVNDDGTRKPVKFTNGHLDKDIKVCSQYVEADYDEALAAERTTKELIKKTKEKEPKSAKKPGKKAPKHK